MKTISIAEVAKHTSESSCWVILHGQVYDVTDFLALHPGGERVILALAGRDATAEYDAVHPPGLLEGNLKASAKLGKVSDEGGGKEGLAKGKEEKEEEEEEIDVQSLLNLNEIEEMARTKLSKKAWAYYYSAGDDLISKRYNSTVFQQILLRPRILIDCTHCDLSSRMLGHRVGLPIFVSPAAMARLAHPSGERGIADGISPFGAVQIVSNNASMSPEAIVEGSAAGQIFGWQLYVQSQRSQSEAMLARINQLRDKYKFIVLTLDAPVPGKREDDERVAYSSLRSAGKQQQQQGSTKGGVGKFLFHGTASDLTWSETLPWLASQTSLPLVLKGIQTHEDASRAAQFSTVKAIILSNHGGRALDTAPPAMHTLLEIRKFCPEVFDRLEVWIDGGVRRGTDVVKALALGATAVGVGRPPLFGLGVAGGRGVERVFEILRDEMETCLRLLGVANLSELGSQHINSRAVERDIYDGDAGSQQRGLWVKASL